MTVQCCKCKRVREDGRWHPISQTPDGDVSHTYCPICLGECLAEIERMHGGRNRHSGLARARSRSLNAVPAVLGAEAP
jgi:hypothetical protein